MNYKQTIDRRNGYEEPKPTFKPTPKPIVSTPQPIAPIIQAKPVEQEKPLYVLSPVADSKQVESKFDLNALFLTNLKLIKEYYKAMPEQGHTYGIYIVMEMMMGNVVSAMELAQQGKTWKPQIR